MKALRIVIARVLPCAGFVVACAPLLAAAQVPSGAPPVTIGYLVPDTTDRRLLAYDRGVRLGFIEAQRAGALLRREVRLLELGPMADAHAISERLVRSTARALIVPVVNDSTALRLAVWAASDGGVIVASRAPKNALCTTPVFRTAPAPLHRTAALARAIIELAGDGNPGLGTRSASDVDSYAIDLWHPELERFGARQLSDRFQARYGMPMISDSWEGWLAMKVLWESALRASDGDIAAAIARGGFDGHKGAALRFGSADRLLMQPLVVVRRDRSSPDAVPVLVNVTPWPTLPEVPADSSAGGLPCRR